LYAVAAVLFLLLGFAMTSWWPFVPTTGLTAAAAGCAVAARNRRAHPPHAVDVASATQGNS
jgi:hypothetical protein